MRQLLLIALIVIASAPAEAGRAHGKGHELHPLIHLCYISPTVRNWCSRWLDD